MVFIDDVQLFTDYDDPRFAVSYTKISFVLVVVKLPWPFLPGLISNTLQNYE
jgi:hypothetical protein